MSPKSSTDDPKKTGWQAQKSAMTRDSILDAAVACYIEIGYAETTTAKIAGRAKVSRGAMLHHFPSKTDLIRASVEHLHHKMVALYKNNIKKVTRDLDLDERNRRGLEGYWNYLSSDLYTAHHELCVAGRTDSELRGILSTAITEFDRAQWEANKELFPEWSARGELYELALDISRFMMEGMAIAAMVRNDDAHSKRMLDYLGDRLEEIFHQGDGAAIHKHVGKRK